MSDNIESLAVGMVKSGYAVGPVTIYLDSKGKKKPSFPHGSWATTTDPEAASDGFFAGSSGLFVNCGQSGIVVVDVDLHAGSVDGARSLREAGIQLPATPMVVPTWSGGQHYYYRQPEGEKVGTYQNTPVHGVDIRGVGGVVFGPLTQVLRMGENEEDWDLAGVYGRPARALRVDQLPVLSPEFFSAIRKSTKKPPILESPGQPFTGELTVYQAEKVSDWYGADLEAVSVLRDGERHSGLLALLNRLFVRGVQLGYDYRDIRRDIEEAYEASGGTDLDDLREIMRTAVDWAEKNTLSVPPDPVADYIDPEEARKEELIRAEVTKLQIRAEARKRFAIADEIVDLGRELDFSEPADGLYGKSWVQGVIPSGETTLIFGERNVGKSFVAIDLGLCVASGIDWHGRKTTKGNVLYLAGEGAIGLPARRRAWVEHHGGGAPEGFRLRDRIVHLNNPASMEAWQKVIAEQEIDLVIIDTLRRAARGRELENPGDVQETIELVDDLRSARYGTSALVLGHPTKTDPRQPAGAGTLQDALPMIHRLEKDGEALTAEIHMTTTKAKDGPTGPIVTFGMKQVGESLVFVLIAGVR